MNTKKNAPPKWVYPDKVAKPISGLICVKEVDSSKVGEIYLANPEINLKHYIHDLGSVETTDFKVGDQVAMLLIGNEVTSCQKDIIDERGHVSATEKYLLVDTSQIRGVY